VEKYELMKSLMLLTFLVFATNFIVAQPAARSSATATRFRSSNGLVKKTNKPLLQAGPKVKNPRAAGRAGHNGVGNKALNQRQLKGPRYKNLKRSRQSRQRRAKAAATQRKRLSGPRFKNRAASSIPRGY
jgi:hypothetical protein